MEYSTDIIFMLQKKLKEVLSEKRYLHTIGVAYTASALAMCYGISHRKALVAGLLHDCAKEYSDAELLQACNQSGLPVSEYETNNPHLLHGRYGAYLAQNRYHVSDEEIVNAIRFHTTGRPNMTELEQIIFLADYLEPERTQPTVPSLDEIRKIAFQKKYKAIVLVTENTIQYFQQRKEEMDPITYDVLNYYKNLEETN